jgi:conjugative transposon TraJ protein
MDNIHAVLAATYSELVGLSSNMINVARGIAGFGALLYIASRVWQSLARAEPIDVYPMLRPFAIAIAIALFPNVLQILNYSLSPIVTETNKMLQSQKTSGGKTYPVHYAELEAAHKQKKVELYTAPKDEQMESELQSMDKSSNTASQETKVDEPSMFGKALISALRWFLEVCHYAASLIIDVIRTFYLIILSILGPIAFGISVFDGFQSSLTGWISRYINVYLWLPVANILSCVILKIGNMMMSGDNVNSESFSMDGSTMVYMIFMVIGIISYFSVPSAASWIVSAGSMGPSRAMNEAGKYGAGKAASVGGKVASAAGGFAGAAVGNIAGQLKKLNK